MHLFRSSFLLALIALLFAGTIVERAFGACEPATVEHAHGTDGPEHSGDHQCHCICHQVFLNERTAPAFNTVVLTVLALVSERSVFPPDAIPVGIDHPPQLA